MEESFQARYPSIEHLRERARHRMPRFAFEYLEGGCNSEINLRRNTEEIRQVQLRPWYSTPSIPSRWPVGERRG